MGSFPLWVRIIYDRLGHLRILEYTFRGAELAHLSEYDRLRVKVAFNEQLSESGIDTKLLFINSTFEAKTAISISNVRFWISEVERNDLSLNWPKGTAACIGDQDSF